MLLIIPDEYSKFVNVGVSVIVRLRYIKHSFVGETGTIRHVLGTEIGIS